MAKFAAKLHGKPVTLCSTDLGPFVAYGQNSAPYDAFGMLFFANGDCLGCSISAAALVMHPGHKPQDYRWAEDLAWLESVGVTDVES